MIRTAHPKLSAINSPAMESGLYDAEIAYTDHIVGRIIAELENKNILKDTLVLIVGDHGESFGEHLEFGHGIFCYDDVLKVPLIIHNPSKLPLKGHRVVNRVNLVDLLPTILETIRNREPCLASGTEFCRTPVRWRRRRAAKFLFRKHAWQR